MKQYVLGETLYAGDRGEESAKRVTVVSLEEFREHIKGVAHRKAMMQFLSQMAYCKAQMFGSYLLGTLCLPVKHAHVEGKLRCGFCLEEGRLCLIGEESVLVGQLERMKESRFALDLSLAGFFCALLHAWTDEDAIFLQSVEENLSAMEEELLASLPNRFYERLIVWRRDLVALHACYDQLSSMGESLRASTSPLIQEEDRLAFGYLSDRAERFLQHVESLREDLLHIREMYQTQIGVRQSRVMTMLAVISAIFLPLTLLVGWYGMNFAYMPELHWAYGYPVVIALSVVIVVVEIAIFRHNRWL